ncbi:hypothetical protein EVAR_24661_1 [Eumeta japonica]|uniref:Uncharacterized protein n=1 Tax=Eumeta variegata TaxID=151549 RepID=A0A4C1V2I6_EUMVA|nr:hypothetical protein EVAR_24661_1 [Eumeta japonica]
MFAEKRNSDLGTNKNAAGVFESQEKHRSRGLPARAWISHSRSQQMAPPTKAIETVVFVLEISGDLEEYQERKFGSVWMCEHTRTQTWRGLILTATQWN